MWAEQDMDTDYIYKLLQIDEWFLGLSWEFSLLTKHFQEKLPRRAWRWLPSSTAPQNSGINAASAEYFLVKGNILLFSGAILPPSTVTFRQITGNSPNVMRDSNLILHFQDWNHIILSSPAKSCNEWRTISPLREVKTRALAVQLPRCLSS